jgi:cell division protein FtsL
MMLRLLNLIVIGALVFAAARVYEIKYSSTRQAEHVAKLRLEIKQERDAIAALRAEWATLNNPDRVQMLARRHLNLRPIEAAQFESLDGLPDRPIVVVPPGTEDPIGAIIKGLENLENVGDADVVTSTIPAPGAER